LSKITFADYRNAMAPPRKTSTRVVRRQVDRSSSTQRALIEAAAHLLVERGHAGTTIADVAERAGLTRGAIQHQFLSRQDFWIKTLQETHRRMDHELSWPDLLSLPIDQRADAIVDRYWSVFGGPLFIVALEIRLMARIDPELQSLVQSEFVSVAKIRNSRWIVAFQDSGIPTAELIAVRRLMLDLLRGFALRKMTQGLNSISSSDVSLAKKLVKDAVVSKPPSRKAVKVKSVA
jgi:AcrR family transcriptional regulator